MMNDSMKSQGITKVLTIHSEGDTLYYPTRLEIFCLLSQISFSQFLQRSHILEKGDPNYKSETVLTPRNDSLLKFTYVFEMVYFFILF